MGHNQNKNGNKLEPKNAGIPICSFIMNLVVIIVEQIFLALCISVCIEQAVESKRSLFSELSQSALF